MISTAVRMVIVVGTDYVERCKQNVFPFPDRILYKLFISRIRALREQIDRVLPQAFMLFVKDRSEFFQPFNRVVPASTLAVAVCPIIVPGCENKGVVERLIVGIHFMIDFFRAGGAASLYITYMHGKSGFFFINGGDHALKSIIIIGHTIGHIADSEETEVVATYQDEADEESMERAEEVSEDILDVDADISASSDDVIAEVDEILGADELRPLDEENTDNAAPADSAEAAEGDVPPLVLENETSVSETDDDHDDYNDDDEFDLEEEMAKVEAELSARKGDDIARHGLPRHVEDAMSRIMSQTDQHLNQPENRRHRDAFAQLKAAVAATEAARQLGDKGADQRDPDEAYKDDLGAHSAKDKSDARSTPPLKLVKSQEVKPPVSRSSTRAAVSTPLDTYSDRLRQIATLKDAEPVEDKGGFADFASAHGATDLVDRLEAAGAYICLVEGEADFSRPQVMKVVQSATAEEISREDGLRSFGRLLRQARLVKLENGRFQIADNTQYRPLGGRAAQG